MKIFRGIFCCVWNLLPIFFFVFLHSFSSFLHSGGKKKSKNVVFLSKMKTENGILSPVSHVLSFSPSLHQALDCIPLYTETESKEREKGLTCGSQRVTLTSHWWKVKYGGSHGSLYCSNTKTPCHQLGVSPRPLVDYPIVRCITV